MEAFETFEHAGCTISLEYDPDPSSPDDWDNLGTFTHWHRGYTFGDPVTDGAKEALERGGPRLLKRYLELCEHAAVVIPVGMLDHSGLHVYPGGGPAIGDAQGWDSGTVGFMWTTHQRLNELCGESAEYHTAEWITEALNGEIRVWDDYLGGRVIGYTVERNGEHVDSCWGFYPDKSTRDDVHGFEYVRAEARDAAEYEANEVARAANQDIATLGRTP